ncbi:MAG: FtsK/SpoIIIE domain-containing protein [Varibaculum sp.]|nr:FtsK/SpoIIIE domain-containing protein [Varibaculum sp.]
MSNWGREIGSGRHYLEVVAGPETGRCFTLPVTAGSTELNDPCVSRKHLRVGADLSITDLGSRNGTRLEPPMPLSLTRLGGPLGDAIAALLPGYRISCGNTVLRIRRRPRDTRITPISVRRNRSALFLLPLVGMATLLAWRVFPPLLWLLPGIVALTWVLHKKTYRPAELIFAAASTQATPDSDTANGPWVVSLGGRHITLNPGDHLCVTGAKSQASARWVAGQLLTIHHLDLGTESDEQRQITVGNLRISWRATSEPLPADSSIVARSRGAHPGEQWWRELVKLTSSNGLPETLRLDELLGNELHWDASANSEHPHKAYIGMGPSSPIALDLDTPHYLVGGTTGSGKSVALTTMVCALAQCFPPAELNFVLIDFKGGEAFGKLAQLPHVCGVLTNLDAYQARRAISGIGRELEQRQASGEHTPRIVVVIDEFRQLATQYPEVLEDLVATAVLGRSLGLNLILATQRPAGVVSPDIKANVAGRIGLRMLDTADSMDVLDSPAAANLEKHPGRAYIGSTLMQFAQADPEKLLELTRQSGQAPAVPLWSEPLPERCNTGTHWALVDDTENRQLWRLPAPETVSLMVAGGPGSGRSSVLRRVKSGRRDVTDIPVDDAYRAIRSLQLAIPEPGLTVIDGAERLIDIIDSEYGYGTAATWMERLIRTGEVAVSVDAENLNAAWSRGIRTRCLLQNNSLLAGPSLNLPKRAIEMLTTAGRGLITPGNLLVQWGFIEEMSERYRVRNLPEPHVDNRVKLLGWGGDDACEIEMPPAHSWLVAGPAGSGKSTAIARLARNLPNAAVIPDWESSEHAGPMGTNLELPEHVIVGIRTDTLQRSYHRGLANIRANGATILLGDSSDISPLLPKQVPAPPNPELIPGRGILGYRNRYLRLQIADLNDI